MIVSSPGLRRSYPSYACSPYWIWFKELGYERLDITQWDDGEWAILEWYQTPVIPAETKWNYVLTGLRNIAITPGFVTKYIHQLDLHRKEVWNAAERKSAEADQRHATMEQHAEDTANAAFKVIRNNPELMERVAENGLAEIDPRKLLRNIPSHQLIGLKS